MQINRPLTTEANWPAAELETIGAAQEIGLASGRPDGSLRPFVTMWVVQAGDGLYVRLSYRPDNPWYRRAVASGTGRVRADGNERDVAFTPAGAEVQENIDAAYHAKYDRYEPRIVGSVTGPASHAVTVRLIPPGGR